MIPTNSDRALEVITKRVSRPGEDTKLSAPSGGLLTDYQVMTVTTADATPALLVHSVTNPLTNEVTEADALVLENNSVYAYTVTVLAVRTGGVDANGAVGDNYKLVQTGVILRLANAASTVIATAPTDVHDDSSDPTHYIVAAAVTADTTLGGIAITGTGEADQDTTWEAQIELQKVAVA